MPKKKTATFWIARDEQGSVNLFVDEPKLIRGPWHYKRWYGDFVIRGLHEVLIALFRGALKDRARKITIIWED